MFAQMKTSWKQLAVAASLLGSVVLGSSAASAAPIGNASFGIGGAFNITSGSNLGNTNSIFIANGGMILVTAPDTMDLAGIVNLGQTGTLADLPNLSGFTPITNYLTLSSGVAIDLNTLTVVSQTGPIPGFINISGNVVVHAPGFDSTSGVLTFTGNSSDNNSFTLAVTTSVATPPSQVPEPLSLSLLGLGLLGMFYVIRRQRSTLSMGAAA